jgi:hypothetical protein
MPIQPHVIKAGPGRIAFIFISMVAIQFACFKFLQYSDYITPLFGITVTVLLILFIFSIYMLWMVFQHRTPRIIFNLEDLKMIKYTAKTRIKYADITGFNILCQNIAKSRPAVFHKLNNRQFRFIDFLCQKDIANFNYDQKLNKNSVSENKNDHVHRINTRQLSYS